MSEAQRLELMERAAAVAGRVLADVWPDGPEGPVRTTVDPLFFTVEAERNGDRITRTGEVMGAMLWDVVHLTSRSEPFALPSGTRLVSPGIVSVGFRRRWFRRSPRPVYWTESEIEDLCRQLNASDMAVLAVEETWCRVCGFDWDFDGEFWFAGIPEPGTCPCCGSQPGVDDLRPDLVAQARKVWIERGRPWVRPEERPADWDPDAALAALPPKWRDL